MKIDDLSMPIGSETPVFPAYPKPVVRKWTSIEEHGFYSNVVEFMLRT